MRTLVITLLLSAALFAQTPRPQVAEDNSAASVLMQADTDFCTAVQARGLEGWMEYMADDAVIQREKPYVGREAIRAAVAADWSNPKHRLTWTPDRAQLFDSGKFGYTTGHFESTNETPEHKTVRVTGQYLTVWKRQKDGTWKVSWDGGSATSMKIE